MTNNNKHSRATCVTS